MGLVLDRTNWQLLGTLSWVEILSAWGSWTEICQIQLGGIHKQTTSSHPTHHIEAEKGLGELHISDAMLQPGWGSGLIIQFLNLYCILFLILFLVWCALNICNIECVYMCSTMCKICVTTLKVTALIFLQVPFCDLFDRNNLCKFRCYSSHMFNISGMSCKWFKTIVKSFVRLLGFQWVTFFSTPPVLSQLWSMES